MKNIIIYILVYIQHQVVHNPVLVFLKSVYIYCVLHIFISICKIFHRSTPYIDIDLIPTTFFFIIIDLLSKIRLCQTHWSFVVDIPYMLLRWQLFAKQFTCMSDTNGLKGKANNVYNSFYIYSHLCFCVQRKIYWFISVGLSLKHPLDTFWKHTFVYFIHNLRGFIISKIIEF